MLGKIVLFFASAILLFGAVAKTNKTQVILGESVILTLSAKGQNIEFPKINQIDSFYVQGAGSEMERVDNNGEIKQTISRSYAFYPDRNVTILPMDIVVDGKIERTKTLHVELIDSSAIKNQEDFELLLDVDNKTPYIGELLKATIVFKYSERVQMEQASIESMNFDSFWVNKKPLEKQERKDGYHTQSLTFWISPLKEGRQVLGPVAIKAGIRQKGKRDVFGMFFQKLALKHIHSKKVFLDVKPLPNGVQLVGDFSISAFADKEEVESGKPVNVTLEIRGNGNFDDIEKMSMKLDEAVVYDDKPSIKTTLTTEGLFGVYRQKFAVIPSSEITIAPFELKFLDKKTKKVKILHTKPIKIKVKESTQKSVQSTITNPINKKIVVKKEGFGALWLLVAFIFGLMVGLVALVFKKEYFKPKIKKPFKSQKELFQELLPHYGKNQELDEEIVKLESNLYRGTRKENIDKNKIKNALKELEY